MDPGSYMIGSGNGLLTSNQEIWERLSDIVGEEERDTFLLDLGGAYFAEPDLESWRTVVWSACAYPSTTTS